MNNILQIKTHKELSLINWKQIVSLEKKHFLSPWSMKVLQSSLEEPYFFFVHKKEEIVIAYAIFLLALNSVDLLNICVNKTHQGTGIAQLFLSDCLAKITDTLNKKNIFFDDKEDLKKCFLEVRASNIAAITFYKKCGFLQINIRKAYYEDNKEDAIVMLKQL